MRLLDGSGVSREAPAPFWEGLRVKFPRPTHHEPIKWIFSIMMASAKSLFMQELSSHYKMAPDILILIDARFSY